MAWRSAVILIAVIWVCLGFVPAAYAQDEPRLLGSVDQQAVAEGETLTYTLTLETSGQAKIERLERPNFGTFGVLGSSKGTQFQSVNGKTRLSYNFSFQLRATREGAQTIGAAKAIVNGKKITSNQVTVKVTPRGSKPAPPPAAQAGAAVFAEVNVSETSPYVGSQVQVVYKLYLDESRIGPFGAELSALQEPEFDGFWIEEIETPRRPRGKTEIINGRRYTTQVIKKLAVFPLKAGKATINPLQMEIEASRRGSFGRRRVDVTTEPVTIDVKPLPVGAPEGFSPSNVGQFRFEASVDKRKAAIGEPFTIRLEVKGTGMIGRVKLPELKELGSARVLDPVFDKSSNASARIVSGRKAAEIVVTPTEEGTLLIPQLAFHYFDPTREKYITRNSPPVAVRVSGRSTHLEKEVELIEREEAEQPEAVQIARRPLKALRPLPDRVEAHSARASALTTPWFILGMAGPPLLFGLWLGLAWFRRHRDATQDDRKRRDAPKVAAERLHEAQAQARSGQADLAVSTMTSAMNTFLAERLELPPGALSASRLRTRLTDRGVDSDVIEQLLEIRQRCDEARFSPLAADDVETLVQRTVSVFESLRRTL